MQTLTYPATILCLNALILIMFHTKVHENRSRPLNLNEFNFFNLFYCDIKFLKFDVFAKLPNMWERQNQATYSLKKRTISNTWGSNMGIPIRADAFFGLILQLLIFFLNFWKNFCNLFDWCKSSWIFRNRVKNNS